MKKYLTTKAINWVKTNRLEAITLFIILAIGAYFRLYRISEYMTFLGDEGRDAIVVRRLLVDFDPILIGPRTSIGDMYLGPLYYYLIAPFLLLANFSPAGPSVLVALFGVSTIFLVWYIAREWFSTNLQGRSLHGVYSINAGALVAALLYATSPVVINYSKSSWNPNIMPFFALLSIYSIWQVWRKNKFGWLIILGVTMAFVLQSHYLGLLLIPTLGLFWLLTFLKIYRSQITDHRSQLRGYIRHSIIGVVIFAVLMSPLVLFDARHGWRNFDSMKRFFTQRQTTISARPWTAIPDLPEITTEAVTRLTTAGNEVVGTWAFFLFVIGLFVVTTKFLVENRKFLFSTSQHKGALRLRQRTVELLTKSWYAPYLLITFWVGVALVGLALYKQEIYDHYYGFFFAAPFLLIGGIIQSLLPKKFSIWHLAFGTFVVYLLFINLQNSPLKYPPNRQMQRSIEVSDKIIEEAGGEKFNLAVLAERNYEGAYQYFLEKEGAPIVMIDPQRAEETVAEQLFVVCELPRDECDPVNNPKAEIANFGWSKIESEWQTAGITLFKLVPNK